jgi:hypothetical protein
MDARGGYVAIERRSFVESDRKNLFSMAGLTRLLS